MLTRATPSEEFGDGEGTMRVLAGLVAALAMATVVAVSPASARVVRMQTVVGLTDRSDPAIKQAVREAFDTSLRGAVAMGFSGIQPDGLLAHSGGRDPGPTGHGGSGDSRDGWGRR